VRLGVLATIPTAKIEEIVRLHKTAPYAERLEIVEGVERDLLARLDRGRIDIALTLLPQASKYMQDRLYKESYALAVSATHRHAASEIVDAEELAGEVMIVRRHCEALSATSQFFTARGVRPEFSFRSDNDDRVLALVRAGLGITLMPESYEAPGVRRPKLKGFERQREIGLLYASTTRDDPVCAATIGAIRLATAPAA
jgi:DNA-binding transcriptional LysR family regulator